MKVTITRVTWWMWMQTELPGREPCASDHGRERDRGIYYLQ